MVMVLKVKMLSKVDQGSEKLSVSEGHYYWPRAMLFVQAGSIQYVVLELHSKSLAAELVVNLGYHKTM